jgi:hypothetical protein
MLDPRIYRAGLVVVLLAVIVLAFSLQDQQGGLGTTLAPDAFNGQNAVTTMNSISASYPERRPGSFSDDALASHVVAAFQSNKLIVSTSTFTARTVDGNRTLETVTGTFPGILGGSGNVVVVAARDALSSPAAAQASSTATLIELSRALAGETHHRTIELVSISGSAGGAGAMQLARTLPGPVDAVIVLGDLAGTPTRQPIVASWSTSQLVAPPMLRNTIAGALSAQAGLGSSTSGLGSEFAHLAFPLAIGDQGPLGAHGYPAVMLSMSGELGPSATEPVDAARLTAVGRGVLQTISALDAGPTISSPSTYLLFSGKVVPKWAVSLFVLALMVPVMMATIDGLARARRRGDSISRWVIWVLAAALPFALAVLAVLGARLVGLFSVAPPGPVMAGAVPLHGAGVAVLIVCGLVFVASFAGLRPLIARAAVRRGSTRAGAPPAAGAGAAVLLVLCLVTLALWVSNPFAAALLVPALHLWMWIVDPDLRPRAAVVVAALVVGLAPLALVLAYYAGWLGLSPVEIMWNGSLLLAGGYVGLVTAILWSVVLGCVASVIAIAVRQLRAERPEQAPITVRGPATYAGPGSLGGTESALRR